MAWAGLRACGSVERGEEAATAITWKITSPMWSICGLSAGTPRVAHRVYGCFAG